MKNASPYDIDQFDKTSLTWVPVAHAATYADAIKKLAAKVEQAPGERFRVREKAGRGKHKIIAEAGSKQNSIL